MEMETDVQEDTFYDSIPTYGKGFFYESPDNYEPQYKTYYIFSKNFPEDTVALNRVTPDLNMHDSKTSSLSIYIREDKVPKEYLKLVFLHEWFEGQFNDHCKASQKDEEYAKRYLTKDKYNSYILWKKEVSSDDAPPQLP